MILPLFIKGKRKLLDLTQQDLADKAGVSIRFIHVDKSLHYVPPISEQSVPPKE